MPETDLKMQISLSLAIKCRDILLVLVSGRSASLWRAKVRGFCHEGGLNAPGEMAPNHMYHIVHDDAVPGAI